MQGCDGHEETLKDASSNSKEKVHFFREDRLRAINKTLVFQRELGQRPFSLSESSHCMKEVVLKIYLASNV